MGTSVGSKVFTEHGWRADASLNLAWTGWTLFVLFLRGPHCPRYTWIGWQGGFELRKSKVRAREEQEKQREAENIRTDSDGVEQGEISEEKREKKDQEISAARGLKLQESPGNEKVGIEKV